jgi:hypothetical protein
MFFNRNVDDRKSSSSLLEAALQSDSLTSRIELAWQRVEEANDAPYLLSLIQQLQGSEDFRRVHEELTIEVLGGWRQRQKTLSCEAL